MNEVYFTHGVWRTKPGREAEFISAWKDLVAVIRGLPLSPSGASLIQSLTDSTLFYSFGQWGDLQEIQTMRNDPKAQAGLDRLRALCVEASPGNFRLVAEFKP